MANHEMLVIIENPTDFTSWPEAQKFRFYEKIIAWHDYISGLRRKGLVTQAWGAHRYISNVRPSETKYVQVAIYEVGSFTAFDDLLWEDPLFDVGLYFTPSLQSIEGDYEFDLARYHRARARLEHKLGKKLPEPVVTYPEETPWIIPKPAQRECGLQVMVNSHNTPGLLDASDEQILEYDEAVLRMHDYHRKLREANIITHEWGHHDFTDWSQYAPLACKATGTQIYCVDSEDEFDQVFRPDPLRGNTRFWTILLLPFEESKRRAEQELNSAKTRVR